MNKLTVFVGAIALNDQNRGSEYLRGVAVRGTVDELVAEFRKGLEKVVELVGEYPTQLKNAAITVPMGGLPLGSYAKFTTETEPTLLGKE